MGPLFTLIGPESSVNPARNSTTQRRQPRPVAIPTVFRVFLAATPGEVPGGSAVRRDPPPGQ
jgi:hypothetical protein